jgi:hypothetical protein
VRARSTLLSVVLIFALLGTPSASAWAQERGLTDARDAYLFDRIGLMTALTAWAAINVVGGAVIFAAAQRNVSSDPARREFQRAFGAMALAYGLVNGALAIATLATLSKTKQELSSVANVMEQRRQSGNVFAVNVGLDMLSVGVGAVIRAASTSPTAQGSGASVVAQGIFLVGFDALGTVVYRY